MISRFIKVTAAALLLTLFYLAERRRGVAASSSSLPVRLRQTLDDLGATFIKIGQALSMRTDLLPESYLNELREHAPGEFVAAIWLYFHVV